MFNCRKFLIDQYHRVIHLRDTPHSVAGGVAIGIFFGFLPFLGLKTLMAVVVAWFSRCSKLAAVIAVSLHDVLWVIPFLPPWLVRVQYQIGFLILHHRLPPGLISHGFHSHHFSHLLHWRMPNFGEIQTMWEGVDSQKWMIWDKVVHIGYPMLLGAVAMGLPLAGVAYIFTLKLLIARQKIQEAAASTASAEAGSQSSPLAKPDDESRLS